MATTLKIVDGDVAINHITGRFVAIGGKDATRQHVAENLSIDTLPNGFGAGIRSLVGTVPQDTMAMSLVVNQHLISSFTAMRALQLSSPNIPRTTDEIIAAVRQITVIPAPTDPRNYLYSAAIVTEAGKSMVINDTLTR